MKTSCGIAKRLLCIAFSVAASGLTAQSNVYEFNSLTEKKIKKNKEHKEKGWFSVSISPDESKMSVYWDLTDLSDRTDFDLTSKRDTVINNRHFCLYTGMICAFKNYPVQVYYPSRVNEVREFNLIDKRASIHYIFKQ